MQLISDSQMVGEKQWFQEQDYEKIDFRKLLEQYGLSYKNRDFHLQVGEIAQVQGWILHISVGYYQLLELSNILIPELVKRDIPFCIVRDIETGKHLQYAHLGYELLGKIFALYPKEGVDISSLVRDMIELTRGFNGPSIPTDRHLGEAVYTRYGSYNPMTVKESPGKRFIYNSVGELVPDEYTFPFQPPEGVPWPFESITTVLPPPMGKLLKDKYKLLNVIKDDVKGRVIKGIYMKGFMNIRQCIIKEGKRNMWLDERGRDIPDRLKWQYELYKDLRDSVPLPEIFDLFEVNGDTYLAMEYIRGRSMEDVVYSSYRGRNWLDLSKEEKSTLLDLLIRIVGIVITLHSKGYVHRDITPANFLIDKKKNIFLIDLELAYSLKSGYPDPPFKLGTKGYMSPEQLNICTPTVVEDAYAVGALMTFVLTGLPPLKFDTGNNGSLADKVDYFIRNEKVSHLISRCLSAEPGSRPAVAEVLRYIVSYRDEVMMDTQNSGYGNPVPMEDHMICELIAEGLKGMKKKFLITSDLMWDSVLPLTAFQKQGYVARDYLPALYNGMSGIVYCLSIAHKLGYDISMLLPAYQKSLEYLVGQVENGIWGTDLSEGKAGIALAMAEGASVGLLDNDAGLKKLLNKCFEMKADELGAGRGIAGQGLALLNCREFMDRDFYDEHLAHCVETILNRQLRDGSWEMIDTNNNRRKKVIGLANGIPGIIVFLLEYAHLYPGHIPESVFRKSLNWFLKIGKRRNGNYFENKRATDYSYLAGREHGIPGMALTFIKAYQYFNDPVYKKAAEGALFHLPAFPSGIDLSQSTGISGLGEIYLEAFAAFGTEEWMRRASWIAGQLPGFMLADKRNEKHWVISFDDTPVADLMNGNCGVIHFLMKYRSPHDVPILFANSIS